MGTGKEKSHYICSDNNTASVMKVAIYSILYMFGLGDNPITMQHKNDCQSIRSDWQKIGMDIYNAMQKYEAGQTKN